MKYSTMNQTTKIKDILRKIIPWAIEKNAKQSKYRTNYKGNRGRIGIVGGARDYSGAPYFASISAMRLGADLAYVICSSTASQSIKNYSPDLIVTPLLDCPNEKEFSNEIECLMGRLHALVIGPGLGRDQILLDRARDLVLRAKDRSMPLIFDADSLLFVNDDPTIVKSYPKAILTPNRVELQRLYNSMYNKNAAQIDLRNMIETDIIELVKRCSKDLKVTILAKGLTDIIVDQDGSVILIDPHLGSNRRCGGQGDITAGLAAVYAYWIELANRDQLDEASKITQPYMWAAYLAALTTRVCNEITFKKHHNGMLASDMIHSISETLDQLLNSPLPSSGISNHDNDKLYAGLFNGDEISRYARQMIMDEFGPERQMNLKKSSALIVGAGGLGCPASVYLAAAGIGRLGIVDNDVVEVSNLHRQILHNVHKVGNLKTESIKQSLIDINTNILVETHSFRLDRWNAVELIERYDMVIDATDNLLTRYLISDACVVAKRPLISGAALKMCGQLTVYNYDADTPCFRCLFPEPPPPNAVGSCSENGVLGVLPGIIGVQQALEAIKIGAGLRPAYAGKMLTFDGELGQFRHITLSSRKKDCEACSASATLNRDLIDYEQFCLGNDGGYCTSGRTGGARSGGPNLTTTTMSKEEKTPNDKAAANTTTSNNAIINTNKPNNSTTTTTTTTPKTNILSEDERITVGRYKQILDSGRKHVLIDVRPRVHSDVSRFAHALQIPLAELQRQPESSWKIIETELKAKETNEIYVVCRRGIASQSGTRRLQELLNKYAHESSSSPSSSSKPDGGINMGEVVVKDIIGGMTVWAAEVDSSYTCI